MRVVYVWLTKKTGVPARQAGEGTVRETKVGKYRFVGQRYHAHHGTTGYGHVYQGRYKSFPVQDDDHFHVVCRYVERSAMTANLVDSAESYRWSSFRPPDLSRSFEGVASGVSICV